MKKVLYLIIINIIILSIFNTIYAQTPNIPEINVTNDSIVSTSSSTVSLNSEFYLILNLSKISYSKFKVEITNTLSLQAEDITIGVSDFTKNNIVTSFIVDKKNITLDKLGIVYISPAQISTIKFSVKITNLESSIDEYKQKLNTLETEIENLESNVTTLKNSLLNIEDIESDEYKNTIKAIDELTLSIESKIQEKNELLDKIDNFKSETLLEETIVSVEEKMIDKNEVKDDEMDKKPWDDKDFILDEKMKEKDKEMNTSMKKMMEQMNGLELDLQNANNKISSLTQSVIYQGSQNNYLSSLSINDVELKNSFKKTTTTYFANVGPDVTSVKVNAVAEDSSSIVTVYGNTNLEQGKNKIMINVTADDGSVRTYKIYITK